MSLAESEIKIAVGEQRDIIPDSDTRYFNRIFQKDHLFPICYGTPKVHKDKNKLGYFSIRSIGSKYGSFIEVASKYCDYYLSKLIPFVTKYLKDSYILLHELTNLQLPPAHNLLIFTSNAIRMYTNIDTNHGLVSIENFLYENLEDINEDFPHELITRLLKVVMKYNMFQFGDLFFLQKQGTAMDTSTTCKYATLYLAGDEKNYIIPKYKQQLIYFRRYIDDIFGGRILLGNTHGKNSIKILVLINYSGKQKSRQNRQTF